VKGILHSVVTSLTSNPELKFNWSDTNFLARWYREQAPDT
jgi:epididymis-specific alpha-mannosidase